MNPFDDAYIEDDPSDTVNCDLCGSPFDATDNGPVIIDADNTRLPSTGTLGGQLKLCEHCAQKVHDAYREGLRGAGVCEHGINDGEYCEDCNAEYKRARGANP